MNQTGPPYQRLQKPAMNWYHASARRVVWGVANARRLHLSAQLCVHVKGNDHRIDSTCTYNNILCIVAIVIILQDFYKINHKELGF